MASPAESSVNDANSPCSNGAAAAECSEDEESENFQGPHKWRQYLRHVKTHGKLTRDDIDPDTDSKEDAASDRMLSVVSEEEQTGHKVNLEHNRTDIPPWRKEYLEKKKHNQSRKPASAGTSQIPISNLMRRRSNHLSGTESAFTRQVVNNGMVSTASRKKVSPSNSFRQNNSNASSHIGRRTPSQGSLTDAPSNYLTQKRIERVQRARLYLLQQTGPNSFLIGGDSPDHKFRVIIGPQTCSCGRGPHCVHVLFVMLRVFQVGENDSCLWSKTLKNYEVENLFRIYHDKRSLRLTQTRRTKVKEDQNASVDCAEATVTLLGGTSVQSENDTGSTREEEDTCPICLLEMLEGESLIKCENGCHNRLHHHCIAIWFEECRRQNDPLNCPLCRAHWTTNTVEIKINSQNENSEQLEVPPNTRTSSPQPSQAETDGRLPHAEPLAQEFEAIAAPWLEALGEDLVNCLFSRNWSFREAGLKHLSREIMGALLRSAGEGRSGAIVSSTRQAATNVMLETASDILAHMCADPVYRVFVACLRSVRTMLAYTPCRDEQQQERLHKLLKPIVDAIILKCTDGNRRTSQLSLSTLVELAKGQRGELSVGREILNPGLTGLDGLEFVIKCATEGYDVDTTQWQWLLGRLYVLDKLIEEFPHDFLPHHLLPESPGAVGEHHPVPEEAGAAAGEPAVQNKIPVINYERIMSVAKFAAKAVCSSHMRIARMSRRVFLLSAKLSAHLENIVDQFEELLNDISSSSVLSLKRKLRRIVADFQLSERIVHELQHGSEKFAHYARLGSSTSTPVDSPTSSPRCNSPTTSPGCSSPNTIQMNEGGQAPPNTPTHRKKCKLKRNFARRSFRDALNPQVPPSSPDETQSHLCDQDEFMNCSGTLKAEEWKSEEVVETRNRVLHKLPNPPKVLYTSPGPPRTLSFHIPTIKVNEVSNSTLKATNNSICLFLEESEKTVHKTVGSTQNKELVMLVDEGDIKIPPFVVSQVPLPPSSKCSCACHGREHGLYDDAASQTSGMAGLPNSPESYQSRSCFHTAEQESVSSDDFLDFVHPSTSASEKPVSFKSEVAESPKTSPSHTLSGSSSRDKECPSCKEEVEKEEAEALAKAMEVSEHQNPIPVVPGLTPTAREEVITIRIQPDDHEGLDENSMESSTSGQPQMYMECIHWVKGPLLGTGAYSTCYQARDVRTGVIMAVKQISFCRNSPQEQESVIEAITAEIHMMARLSHPNIVRILGATKQGCHFNMFVEWMSGGSVAFLLGQYGAFTEQVIINYTRQILRGLAYLHDNHILHRDLKGANLLVDSTGQLLRIGDFGASARLASKSTGAGEFQGQLLGTIAFMAPEVLRGESYGRACDVWSVGCVMIEMSTCRPPWNSHDISNHLKLIFKIASSVSPPPVPENLSPPVRDVMLRCLEHQSEFRPSAKDLLVHPLFTQYSRK